MDNQDFAQNREAIEPGVMGETEPPEQKMLDHLNTIATGYFLGRMGGSAAEALIGKIGSKLAGAGKAGDALDALHQMAGLTPEESASAKAVLPSQEPTAGVNPIRDMWADVAKEQQGTSLSAKAINEYKYPEMFKSKPDVQVYVKGVQKGFGKAPSFNIYDVKGAPEEIAKLGYGPNPGSIPEPVLKKFGLLGLGAGFPLPADALSQLQSVRDRLKNNESQ